MKGGSEMYFAFESGEGGGKTEQIQTTAKNLEQIGYDVVITKEPGGTDVGQAIRDILLNRRDLILIPRAEVLLFSADRAQLMETVVRPALKLGKIVLSGRTFFSMLVYQGVARVLPTSAVEVVTDFAIENTRPDLVVLLDLDPKIGLSRKENQGEINKIDAEDLKFHQKVRAGYLELAKQDPEIWKIIDASQSFQKVSEDTMSAVLKKLQRAGV